MNNQPAFPSPYDDQEGMTLRDYFAAKAMQGIISTNTSFLHNPEQLAAKAFEFADAMLKAREQ